MRCSHVRTCPHTATQFLHIFASSLISSSISISIFSGWETTSDLADSMASSTPSIIGSSSWDVVTWGSWMILRRVVKTWHLSPGPGQEHPTSQNWGFFGKPADSLASHCISPSSLPLGIPMKGSACPPTVPCWSPPASFGGDAFPNIPNEYRRSKGGETPFTT